MSRRKAKLLAWSGSGPLMLETLEQNAILASLARGPLQNAVTNAGALVHLLSRERVYGAGERIEHVFFPIDCILSVVARMADGHKIEAATIGREGTSGIPLILGAATTANDCYCQVPGRAVKIGVKLFESLSADLGFRRALKRFAQSYANMLSQLVACNALHSMFERFARWLLLSHDRLGSPEIRLSRDYLGMVLGTGRTGVAGAVATFQNAGFLRYSRGIITILSRTGLEGVSCECYEVGRAQCGRPQPPLMKASRSKGERSPNNDQ